MLEMLIDHWLLTTVAVFVTGCVLVAIYDITQKKHTILHNFPVVGHLRYFLEMIGPELRQYWVANDKEEMPFNRDERSWIYASAKGENNTFGFGSTEQMYGVSYPIVKHAAFPFPEHQAFHIGGDPSAVPCLKVMGASHKRRRLYRPRLIINISAMSFGSLGERAISALNLGAAQAGCYHNTGEGGISPYHCLGGDVIWQLGTGYFGARGADGKFSIDEVVRKTTEIDKNRAIEVKLSQGAKPGKGGILPGAKVTAQISKIRGVPIGKDSMWKIRRSDSPLTSRRIAKKSCRSHTLRATNTRHRLMGTILSFVPASIDSQRSRKRLATCATRSNSMAWRL